MNVEHVHVEQLQLNEITALPARALLIPVKRESKKSQNENPLRKKEQIGTNIFFSSHASLKIVIANSVVFCRKRLKLSFSSANDENEPIFKKMRKM